MPFTKKSVTTNEVGDILDTYNGLDYTLLTFSSHNTLETSFIGNYDNCQSKDIPFTSLVSLFYYEPYYTNNGFYDRRVGSSNNDLGLIGSKEEMVANATHTLNITGIPYHERQRIQTVDQQGQLQHGFEWISKTLDNPYLIPNSFNPWLGASSGGSLYQGGLVPSYKTSDNTLSENQEIFLVPPISQLEKDLIINGGRGGVRQNSLHVTADLQTKVYLRSQDAYRKGDLVEYVMMSFGEKKSVGKDGNIVRIKAQDNVYRVPVRADINWVPGDFEIGSEQEKEHLKKYLQISPEFIAAKNKELENTIPAEMNDIYEVFKESGDVKKEMEEFLAFKAAKKAESEKANIS